MQFIRSGDTYDNFWLGRPNGVLDEAYPADSDQELQCDMPLLRLAETSAICISSPSDTGDVFTWRNLSRTARLSMAIRPKFYQIARL
jgi:hypothetical protein